jgi:hypothetical protein
MGVKFTKVFAKVLYIMTLAFLFLFLLFIDRGYQCSKVLNIVTFLQSSNTLYIENFIQFKY